MKYNANDKIVHKIDQDYKLMFKTIIHRILYDYKGIPLTWEDIYYEFLTTVVEVSNDYDPERGVPFQTFIGVKCKYFTRSVCRKWTTKKHSVLNNAYSIEKQFHIADPNAYHSIPIDFSNFTKIEFDIYHDFFIKENNMDKIVRETEHTIHTVRVSIKSIKVKILTQLRNSV